MFCFLHSSKHPIKNLSREQIIAVILETQKNFVSLAFSVIMILDNNFYLMEYYFLLKRVRNLSYVDIRIKTLMNIDKCDLLMTIFN